MKIGIDARPLQGETRNRGIGMTLENLISGFRKISNVHEFIYYIDSNSEIPKVLDDLQKNESIEYTSSSRIRQLKIARAFVTPYKKIKINKTRINIFLQPDITLGLPKNIISCVIYYDLIPLIFRDEEKELATHSVNKIKGILANYVYWHKYLGSLKHYKDAKIIISISNNSKKDILSYIPETESSKVKVIELAPKKDNSNLINKPSWFNESYKYLLYVGGIDYRKNIMGLLSDYMVIKNKYSNIKLICLGKEFELIKQLDSLGWNIKINSSLAVKDSITTPGFVSDEELSWLYKNATAFVFPSRYEGFGLPVLEAMQAGCPVVAYNNSSIPEVAGNAAILVEDGKSMVPAIEKILDDSKYRNELIQLGKNQAAKFSWEKTARETLEVLVEAVNEG